MREDSEGRTPAYKRLAVAVICQALVDLSEDPCPLGQEDGPHRNRHKRRARDATKFLLHDMWRPKPNTFQPIAHLPILVEYREELCELVRAIQRGDRAPLTWARAEKILTDDTLLS